MEKKNNRKKRRNVIRCSPMKGYTLGQISSLWETAKSVRVKSPSLKATEGVITIELADNPTMKTYTPEQITAMGRIAAKHMRWSLEKNGDDSHHGLLEVPIRQFDEKNGVRKKQIQSQFTPLVESTKKRREVLLKAIQNNDRFNNSRNLAGRQSNNK